MSPWVSDTVELIRAFDPLIIAATPLILGVLSWVITSRQTKALKDHSDENRDKIQNSVASASGTYKTLKPPDGP